MKELHFVLESPIRVGDYAKFDILINSKYVILNGMSGTFKTTFIRMVLMLQEQNVDEPSNHIFNIVIGELRRKEGKSAKYFDINDLLRASEDTLFVLDEDVVANLIATNNLKKVRRAKCHVMLIYREEALDLNVSYKDYYVFKTTECVTKLLRKYPDYETWIESDRYIIEDSSTGFQYFKTRVPQLMTAHGKSNLRKFTDDGVIIADGAALSYEFVELFERNAQMYLYDCFEALIVKKFLPEKFYNKYTECKASYFNYEQYFEDVAHEAVKVLGSYTYNKSKLLKILFGFDLLDKLPMRFIPILKDDRFYNHTKQFEECVTVLTSNKVWNSCMLRKPPEFHWIVYHYLWYHVSTSGDYNNLEDVINKLWEMFENGESINVEPVGFVNSLVEIKRS